MTGDTPCWYLALEANDTLRQKIGALQTELFRQFGLVEARLHPPLFFLYRLTGMDAGSGPTKESGKMLLSFGKRVLSTSKLTSKLTIEPPLFLGDEFVLPIKPLPQREEQVLANNIRLEKPEQAAEGFLLFSKDRSFLPESPAKIEEMGKHFFPAQEKLGKMSPLIIRLDTFEDMGSSWTIYK
jgi:hypothetical protein